MAPWGAQAVILTRDLEDDTVPAAVAHPDVAWGSVHVTALYSDEAHMRTGACPPDAHLMGCHFFREKKGGWGGECTQS